jgi:hypothetical protein
MTAGVEVYRGAGRVVNRNIDIVQKNNDILRGARKSGWGTVVTSTGGKQQ